MPTNTNSTNYFSPARWVVSTVAGEGTHKTITAATTSASAGDTIVLLDYVATEDVAMKTGVNYTAFMGASQELTSKVTGKWTYSGAGTVSINNIDLITNSDNLLAITGSSASIVNLNNCNINCLNNTGISFTTSNASASIICNNCTGNLGTTGIGYHSMSSTGGLYYNYCSLGNTGVSVTESANSAGVVYFNFTTVTAALETSSGGVITASYSIFNLGVISNTTPFTTAGTGTSGVTYCQLVGGSASALSVGSGTTVNADFCDFSSGNASAVAGAGTLSIRVPTFSGTTKVTTVTTQTGGAASGLTQGSAPSAGFIGEILSNIGTSIATTSTSPITIQGLNLTPGVWDVEGYAVAIATGGTALMQAQQISISPTNNTINGTLGIGYGQLNIIGAVLGQRAPKYRATLSANTTIYLVVTNFYTSTTCPTNGSITATRVG